jgi:hypothetical protein
MVHDRRIDGQPHVFGNASTLYKNAMTWYDHETDSIWSQPWGLGLQGEYEGVELFLLPFQLTTWKNWRTAHPHTLAMTNDWELLIAREEFDPDFVIGLQFAENNKAYYYGDVAAAGVVNDMLGEFPVIVWAKDNNYQAYLRTVDDRTLTFTTHGDTIIDEETNSTWDMSRGLATDGPLTGQGLQAVPSLSAFDWAWTDFYPQSTFYQP